MRARRAAATVAAFFAAASAFPAAGQGLGFQVGSFTQVTLTGLLAVGLKESQVTNSSRPGLSSETRLDDNTSRLIIGSTSKICDGYNVVFRIESRFQADVRPVDPAYNNSALIGTQSLYSGNITGWADGDTFGGISTPYGTVIFGKSTLYYTDTIDVGYLGLPGSPGESYRIWDANGLGTFNILDQVTPLSKAGVGAGSLFTLGNTRSRNVVRYNSVNYSGFDFSLAWSKNPTGDELHYVAPGTAGYARSYTNGDAWYATARYNKKGFSVQGSYVSHRILGGTYSPAAAAGPADMQAFRLGASYKLPMGLKFGVTYDRTSYDNSAFENPTDAVASQAAKRDTFLIPVSYMWKDHGFYVTYGIAGNTSSHADTGATQWNVGYDYALTKRAFIGLYYTSLKNDTYGRYTPFLSGYSLGPTINALPGENWWQLGLNLNYWF